MNLSLKLRQVKWSSESDIDVSLDVDRVGRLVQITMGTTGVDEAWNVRDYTLMAKPLLRK